MWVEKEKSNQEEKVSYGSFGQKGPHHSWKKMVGKCTQFAVPFIMAKESMIPEDERGKKGPSVEKGGSFPMLFKKTLTRKNSWAGGGSKKNSCVFMGTGKRGTVLIPMFWDRDFNKETPMGKLFRERGGQKKKPTKNFPKSCRQHRVRKGKNCRGRMKKPVQQ